MDRKLVRYRSLSYRFLFIPIAVGTSSVIGPGTAYLLRQIDSTANPKNVPQEVEWLFQRATFAIFKSNTSSILSTGIVEWKGIFIFLIFFIVSY